MALASVSAAVGLFVLTRVAGAGTDLSALTSRSASFDEALGNGRPTVVEFYADWCQVCRETAKETLRVEQSFRSSVNFVFLNIDNVKWAAELDEFGVDGIPHYSFLDGQGNELAYVVGKVPRRILQENVSALAAGSAALPYSEFVSEASDSALRRTPPVVEPRSHSN